jgi:hypothetical protein
MTAPDQALERLAGHLRDDPVIAPHVHEAREGPRLGALAAAGPRAAEAPGEYSFLFEAIREGYLLHYGRSRLLDGADPDLCLLAGDYLYALGLERLAARGDMEAVRELADLISLCAQLHAGAGEGASAPVEALWLSAAVAVAAGARPGHERGKRALRAGEAEAGARELVAAASESADRAGMRDALAAAAEQVGLAIPERG